MDSETLNIRIAGTDDTASAFDSAAKNAKAYEEMVKNISKGTAGAYEDAQKRAEAAAVRFYRTLEQGGAIGERSIRPLIQQHELLRQQIVRTWGSVDQATPQAIAHYKDFTAVVERAKSQTRALNDTFQDQRSQLAEGGVQWRGLNQAINESIGEYGELQMKIVGATMAFREGWQIGSQAARAFGTDMQAMDDVQKGVASSGHDVQNVIVNMAASSRNLAISLASVDFVRVKQDMKEFVSDAAGWLEKFTGIDRGFARASRDLLGVSPQGRPDFTSHQYSSAAGPDAPTPAQLIDAQKAALQEQMKLQTQLLDLRKEVVLSHAYEEKAMKLVSLEYEHQKQQLQLKVAIQSAELDHNDKLVAQLRQIASAETSAFNAKRQRIQLDAYMSSSSIIDRIANKAIDPIRPRGPYDSSVDQMYQGVMALNSTPWPTVKLDPSVLATAKQVGQIIAKEAFARDSIERMTEALRQDFGDFFADLGTTGGKNFGEIAASHFNRMIDDGARDFASRLTTFLGGGSVNQNGQVVDANGNVVTDPAQIAAIQSRSRVAGGALAVAQVGLGSYYNARSADGGNHTASGAIGGLMAGASFGIPGMIAGLIVGGLAGMFGDQQRRADYKYGYVDIVNGQASLLGRKNLTDDAAAGYARQTQGVYDQYRNSYMQTLFSLGMGAPKLGAIDGKFQPSPSGHWAENFQAWLQGKLPSVVAGQFKDTLRTGFGTAGMSGNVFDAVWQKWSNLDPSKMASMFNTLAQTFTGNAKAQAYSGGSNFYGTAQTDVHASFADTLRTSDKDIIEFGSHLKDLVGEDQINAAKELVDMEKSREDQVKQFWNDIVQITEQAHQQIADAQNSLRLQLYRNADGTTDYAGQGDFLKRLADQDLSRLQGSTTAADANTFLQRFMNDVNQIAGIGFNISGQTGKDWTQWAIEQLDQANRLFDQTIGQIGTDFNAANQQFLDQFRPAFDGFTASLGNVSDSIGTIGDDLDRLHDPIDRTIGKFNSLADAVDVVISRMLASGRSSFADRTLAQRAVV
jgi:hypothetical protein